MYRLTLMFALMAAIFPVMAHAASAGPKLVISADKWDVGEVRQWDNPSLTVSLKNVGDEDLLVVDLKSSCGVEKELLSSKTIRPGEAGLLRIDLQTNTLSGRIKKLVRLTTNDPLSPAIDIPVTGFVKGDLAAVGRLGCNLIDLGVVAPYETRRFEVLINNHGNKPLVITGIRLPEGFVLDSGLPGKIESLKALPVWITYNPPVAKGLINESVGFESPDNMYGDLELKVVGYISDTAAAGSIQVMPTGFSVKAGAGGEQRKLVINNSGQYPVTIEGVDSSLDMPTPARYEPLVGPGESAEVGFKISPDDLIPGDKGYLYLRIAIPVSVE